MLKKFTTQDGVSRPLAALLAWEAAMSQLVGDSD